MTIPRRPESIAPAGPPNRFGAGLVVSAAICATAALSCYEQPSVLDIQEPRYDIDTGIGCEEVGRFTDCRAATEGDIEEMFEATNLVIYEFGNCSEAFTDIQDALGDPDLFFIYEEDTSLGPNDGVTQREPGTENISHVGVQEENFGNPFELHRVLIHEGGHVGFFEGGEEHGEEIQEECVHEQT